MISPKQCARCGKEISPDALWGLCHKCLFDEATALPSGEGILSAKNRQFGDYDLGAQLGRGGMGVVYEAVQVSLRRPVALKMILDSEAGSPLAHRRFRVEAEAAAKLDYPNIVPIYEVGEHEGQSFLSMKLIAGNTLREKIASGDLCLKPKGNANSRTDLRHRTVAIVRLMATIARAVDHAHEKNVLHRDLKPSNILIDREGQPHLTDFGLAKMLEFDIGKTPAVALTISGTTLGTPSYMSPEQAAGQRLSAASDIYSLGAILYEMLTGDPPFKAATVLETLRLVADQQPRRPSVENPRIDRDLDTICLKCLEKNPAARYTSALALAEDLERWLRQEPIRARPAGVPLRIGRWVKRNRPAAALIVSLFFGFAMALELLHLAHQKQKRLELIRANNTQIFNEEIENLWRDTNRTYIHIHSSRLAQLVDADPRPPSPDDVRLTFAAVIDADPWGQATKYAPLLTIIEERMKKLCGRPVLIDLRLYKFNGDGGQAPVTLGEVDFQRLGALRYIQARKTEPDLQLIACEVLPKDGVIFVRKELGITNLTQVAGRRLAFAHTNSTVSFLAKARIGRAGLRGHDFSMVSNLGLHAWNADLVVRNKARTDSESDVYNHREVLRQVQANLFDVGPAPRRYFEMNKNRGKGLVELESFPVIADAVVAKTGTPAEMADAFRQSLLSLSNKRERQLLGRLKHDLRGFAQVNDRDYDDLRSMLTNEVRLFEASAPHGESIHSQNSQVPRDR